MYEIIKNHNSGIIEFKIPKFQDQRGSFQKLFNFQDFLNLGIQFEPKEHFHSISKKNVIRGMHFQTDESSHNKIIHCIKGSIVDVCVDIRRSSPFYNQPLSIKLKENSNLAVYVPKGFAHGFLSLEDDTIVQYMADKEHNPLKDKGILWNSIDYKWECNNPILSNRDLSHPSIGDQECIFF